MNTSKLFIHRLKAGTQPHLADYHSVHVYNLHLLNSPVLIYDP